MTNSPIGGVPAALGTCTGCTPSGESQGNVFTTSGAWCQRQWKNLTDHPVEIAKNLAINVLCAAPFFVVNVFFPNIAPVVVISILAIALFARESCRWVLPHAFNGWASTAAFFCVKNVCRFVASGHPAFLNVALIDAAFSSLVFVAAYRYRALACL